MINGQNVTTVPRWIGINKIASTLKSTTVALNDVVNNAKNISSTPEPWTQQDPIQFEQNLSYAYSNHTTDTLPNPNPAQSQNNNSQPIIPLYIKDYGNYTRKDTILNAIFKEYDVKINGSITFINQAKLAARNISDYQRDINSALTTASNSISEFSSTFENVGTIIDTITSTVNTI